MYPFLGTTKRQRSIVIALVIVTIVVIVLASLLGHKSPPHQAQSVHTQTTTRYDANSGETVRSIKGEHGNTGVSTDTPLFLGMSNLLNAGLTTDQLSNLETAFYRYAIGQTPHITQVSVTQNSIQTKIINAGTVNQTSELDFAVVFDGKTTTSAAVTYSGLETVELTLHSTSGALIYDSGAVGTSGD